MSSRSSIFRSPFGASRSADGGRVYAPFLRSTFSGSGSGSEGSLAAIDAGFLIGGGVGFEEAAFRAAAAAPTRAAVFDREGVGGGGSCEGAFAATAGSGLA